MIFYRLSFRKSFKWTSKYICIYNLSSGDKINNK